jgi:hypothetical protein
MKEGPGAVFGSVPLTSVADLDSGSGAFLTPGSGRKNPGSELNTPDNFFESLEEGFGLKILKLIDADPDPGSFWPGIRDGKTRIRDPV